MDFGRLPSVEGLDLSLPPDPPENARVLTGRPAPAPRVIVGCPSWNHPEWIGKVYTLGPKSREFLPEYVRQFNGIEVNATAYNLPSAEKVAHWAAVAPSDFRYCIKFPQTVTHYGAPGQKLELARAFAERIAPLGERLGPPLLQFSERFGPRLLDDLERFLRAYPGAVGPAVELRHPDYFTPEGRGWLERLAALGLPAVITDTAGRRDVVHMRLTAPVTLVRFTGNDLHPSDFARLDAWADRLADWLARGLEQAYFFVHTSPKLNCPDLADYFIQALNRRTQLNLRSWVRPAAPTLFGDSTTTTSKSKPKPKRGTA